MSSIALVTTIENNTDNKNSKFLGIKRKYFDEAIKCFESWNNYMPYIQKYAICPTRATLSSEEINQLSRLGVKYIERYFPETETFENGFINVALSTAYLENIIDEDIIIHTDLDMTLMREIPIDFFNIKSGTIRCGKYDEEAKKSQRVDFDTGFTISLKEDKFYNSYWNVIKKLIDGDISLPQGVLYYDIEEYAMEFINKEYNDIWNIIPILKYQIGEGYPSVDFFKDEELQHIYFWHEHLIHDKKEELVKERIKYIKRCRDANK